MLERQSKEKAFLFLILYRWLTLGNVIILSWVKANPSVLLPVILVVAYNLILSVYPMRIYERLKKAPLLLAIDLIFCALILHLTGGWASPFYLYCISPLLLSALLFTLKGAIYSAATFSFLYISVLYANGYSVGKITEMGRIDSLISNFVSFFLASIFFSYPAVLIEQLETSKRETESAKHDLEQTHKELEIAYKLVPLSKREMDVLHLLSAGKSNKQIAEILFLSESTIKTHVSSILKKLKIKSRTEAISCFYNERSSTK